MLDPGLAHVAKQTNMKFQGRGQCPDYLRRSSCGLFGFEIQSSVCSFPLPGLALAHSLPRPQAPCPGPCPLALLPRLPSPLVCVGFVVLVFLVSCFSHVYFCPAVVSPGPLLPLAPRGSSCCCPRLFLPSLMVPRSPCRAWSGPWLPTISAAHLGPW